MESEPLLQASDVGIELLGFVASFLLLGAVGFRFAVLRSGVASASEATTARAASRAAAVGLAGAALGIVALLLVLGDRAEAKHVTLLDAARAGGAQVMVQASSLVVLGVALVVCWRVTPRAWSVVLVAAVAFALRGATRGKWSAMVNPLHVLGGSLWIGTLFVLVVCGIAPLIGDREVERGHEGEGDRGARRERATAEMVHRFSGLALASAALLGATGIVTAWTHLKYVAALWTTPYGYALLAKLAVVAVVVALGAWNWRRVRPALGSDGGARTLRRTAVSELVAAGVVLVLTAVLVSLPSPTLPALSAPPSSGPPPAASPP
jgi:putative copper export protein